MMFGNNFDQGYQQGQTDHQSGVGKRIVFRPLQRLFKPDLFLPNFNARFSEYWRGYNTGYEDETRTIHTQPCPNATGESPVRNNPEAFSEILNESPDTPQPSSKTEKVVQNTQQSVKDILNGQDKSNTGAASVSNPSIDQQITILNALKSKLESLQANLIDVGNSYQTAVQQTQMEGVLNDYHQLLEQAMTVVHANIKTLYHGIEQEDKVLIKKMIARLEALRDV